MLEKLKNLNKRTFHVVLVAFLVGLFTGINLSFLRSAPEPAYKYLDYFHRTYQLIKSEYVDVPSTKKLFYGAIKGMIHALDDPFSRFLDKKGYEQLREMTTGKFVGVGIVITQRDNDVVVIAPIDDSPAMKAGILSGDIIMKVGAKNIHGMKLREIIKMIKGNPKTSITLSIKREGIDEPLNFTLERAPVKIKSVEYSMIQEKHTGYLKIKNFGADTAKDVARALKYFNRKHIHKLVIDLRNDPGGLLTSSIKIADFFLEQGKLIVSTKGRKGTGRVQEFRSKSSPLYTGHLIVLVNRGSASAAEILSAALRDNNRGRLLGEKTFGKGSVQKTFNLAENIGVAITIAKYYTPSGVCIHKKGIHPDYVVKFDRLSKMEIKNLRRFDSKKLGHKFITKHIEYNKKTRDNFYRFLKANAIDLSKRTADFLLKQRIYRFRKKPPYDLEFDVQLAAALKKLH